MLFQALRGFKLTVSVEPKYHPKIIGKKGAVISQIRKDHDVTIQFPDKGDENPVGVSWWVTFMSLARRKNTHEKKMILEKDLLSHKYFSFPLGLPPTPKQDLITITGYEKNAVAARDAILKIVADLEEMVSEDVKLDHRVHARIIGGRGKAIRKLMEEFRVRSRF